MQIIKQQACTLIELIIILAILGVLAAFAVPRYLPLDSQACVASIQYLAGSVEAASSLVHAIAQTQVATKATNDEGIISAIENLGAQYVVSANTGAISIQVKRAPGACSLMYNDTGNQPSVIVTTIGC